MELIGDVIGLGKTRSSQAQLLRWLRVRAISKPSKVGCMSFFAPPETAYLIKLSLVPLSQQDNSLVRWHLKSRLPVSGCKTPSSPLRLWECPSISPTRCRVNSAPCHHHHRHLWASLKEALLVAVLPDFLHLLLVGCRDTHLRCRWAFRRWGWDLMGCSRV